MKLIKRARNVSAALAAVACAASMAFSGAASAASRTDGFSASAAAPTSLQADALTLHARGGQHTLGTMGQPMITALVDSCSDAWYYRSGIEELTCGFSGQGWYN